MPKDLKKIEPMGLGGVELTTPEVNPVDVPVVKKKSKVGRFFEGLGGAEGVLGGISGLTGEGAKLVNAAKKGSQSEQDNDSSSESSYDFSLGQHEGQETKILGMPPIAFYTLVVVITLLAAFIAYRYIQKKV